jgi:pimeloyl-ACP methyl ester carboxylesterase
VFESREEVYRHFRQRGAFAGWREEYFRAFVEHGVVERAGGGVELASPTWVEAQLYDAMRDVSVWREIRDCQTPILLVYGERGGRAGEGRDPASAVRPLFPRCEVAVMGECTHSGPMERPAVFEGLIREFAGRM